MAPYLEIILRSIIAYCAVLLVSRAIGQKFSIVVGIVVGVAAAIFSLDRFIPVAHGVFALATWSVLYIATQYLCLKFKPVASFVNGSPTIVIDQGNILEKNLRKARMTASDMLALLREQSAFKLSDVELGILESDGQLSVMKKSNLDPITPSLQGIPVELEQSPRTLIVDGEEDKQALQTVGVSKEWLTNQVRAQGATDICDVFLAQMDSKGNLFVDLYNEPPVASKQVQERPLLLASLKKIQADLEAFALQTDNQEAKILYRDQAEAVKQLVNRMMPYLRG